MRTAVVMLTTVLLATGVAQAQIPVIDPGNLAQAVLIAQRTLQEYQSIRAQYETLLRISRGLGTMQGYRLPAVPMASHTPAQWIYGRSWLEALNTGDPTGTGYTAAVRPVAPSQPAVQRLPAAARRSVQSAYATIEIADALAESGGDQVGQSRQYAAQLSRAVAALQQDVVNPAPEYHELTSLLDKVAAAGVIGRQQDMATNALLAHALDQLLVRSKQMRDTEAATMNLRIGGLRNRYAAGDSLVSGAADDLRNWRQP